MTDAACTGHATDGTSCRRGKRPSPDWIIKCDHDNRVADVSPCGDGQMCFSNKNPRFGWTGATAICVDSDKL